MIYRIILLLLLFKFHSVDNDIVEINGKRSVGKMRPFRERHFYHQHRKQNHKMNHIGVVGSHRQTVYAEDMHKYSGEGCKKKQYQKSPVGIMRMAAFHP